MHALLRADDRVDRAGLNAQRATDAGGLVDDGQQQRPMFAAAGVERLLRAAGQRRECDDHGVASGRAAVDIGAANGDRIRVRLAAVVSAPRALRLRQHGVDALGEGMNLHTAHLNAPGYEDLRPSSRVR